MLFRVLCALATIALLAIGLTFFSAEGGRLVAIGLLLAAAMTVVAQWHLPANLLLAAGVASMAGALWFEPNLAVWFGMFGEGLLSPLQSGRNALALTFSGAWLLLLFGRAVATSRRRSDREFPAAD